MPEETRSICRCGDLYIEAYRLKGILQPFPSHFHDYYVIGLAESGTRRLCCNNKGYSITGGDMLLFNPNDSHSCTQSSSEPFDYKAVNISKETMLHLSQEITGKKAPVGFCENVIKNDELSASFRIFHKMITENAEKFEKEENLLIFMTQLIKQYSQPFSDCVSFGSEEIENTCKFINEHFAEHLTLNDLCRCSGLSKSTLLRAFTGSKGVTPYRYLQSIRIDKAKKLLEQGASPIDAAMQTGFSDQSHFTNFFNMFIGLSPAAYRRIFKEDKHGG